MTELDGSAKWLGGMASAAAKHNMSVQCERRAQAQLRLRHSSLTRCVVSCCWGGADCMSHPAAFLEALSFPAVTNGRASGDYEGPDGNLLQCTPSYPLASVNGQR